ERLPVCGHGNPHVARAPPPAILFQLLCYRRFRVERFQQLDQVWPVTHLQQHFAHLIATEHVFAMHFLETHRLVRIHLRFKLAGLHGDRYVVKEQKARHLLHCFIHHSNSTRICPEWTLSPAFTLIAATLPETCAVTWVSIFMASSTSNTSPTCSVHSGQILVEFQ